MRMNNEHMDCKQLHSSNDSTVNIPELQSTDIRFSIFYIGNTYPYSLNVLNVYKIFPCKYMCLVALTSSLCQIPELIKLLFVCPKCKILDRHAYIHVHQHLQCTSCILKQTEITHYTNISMTYTYIHVHACAEYMYTCMHCVYTQTCACAMYMYIQCTMYKTIVLRHTMSCVYDTMYMYIVYTFYVDLSCFCSSFTIL